MGLCEGTRPRSVRSGPNTIPEIEIAARRAKHTRVAWNDGLALTNRVWVAMTREKDREKTMKVANTVCERIARWTTPNCAQENRYVIKQKIKRMSFKTQQPRKKRRERQTEFPLDSHTHRAHTAPGYSSGLLTGSVKGQIGINLARHTRMLTAVLIDCEPISEIFRR